MSQQQYKCSTFGPHPLQPPSGFSHKIQNTTAITITNFLNILNYQVFMFSCLVKLFYHQNNIQFINLLRTLALFSVFGFVRFVFEGVCVGASSKLIPVRKRNLNLNTNPEVKKFELDEQKYFKNTVAEN